MLFLSRRKLKDVVESILKNSTLKNLYLEGNQISNLPDSMFTSLPNLVWLDLRNNQIASLPAGIGLHRSLKTLLLEGNPISELPPELGNVITLKALNLRNCPIGFPPQDIVHQGLQCILQYLRSALAKRPVNAQKSHPDMPPVEKLHLSDLLKSSMDLCEEVVDEEELQRFRELKHKMILLDRAELSYGGPVLPLALLPRTIQGDRNVMSEHLPVIKRKKEITEANVIPELHPFDTQYWKRPEESRLTAMKELKEKQAFLEQRRKDQEVLQEWRTHAKITQERKLSEHRHERHEKQRREEALDKTACTTNSQSSGADKSDTMAHAAHNFAQRRQRSSMSPKEQEEARLARDRELEQQLRNHVQIMQERRRKPRGTVEEARAAAEHDMKETSKLQAELLERKRERDIEYRFLAFIGDTSPSSIDK
ncbi:leucine-rich repeat-containing protein 27-like [Polymixia lowei]